MPRPLASSAAESSPVIVSSAVDTFIVRSVVVKAMLHDDAKSTSTQYREALGKRLHRAIVATGKSYAEVARAVGKQPQAVYGWVKTGRIGKDTLAAVAVLTQTSLEWLVNGQESALEVQPFKVASVPLVEWDRIGSPRPGGRDIQIVATTKRIGASSFALLVSGEAMAREFPDGSTILVDPDERPYNGSYVIAKVNGSHLLRQLKRDGSQDVLVSQSPSFPAIPVTGEVEIVGVVQMVMRWFSRL